MNQFSAGVTVSFQTPLQQVVEGDSVSVCVTIVSGSSEISFVVDLNVASDAEG